MILTLLRTLTQPKYQSVTRYLVIGGTSFGLDLGLLILFKSGLGMPVYLAATGSYVIALIYNFYLNRRWTFGAKGGLETHIVLYTILCVVNYAITLAILDGLGSLGVNYGLAKIASILPILTWNYLAYRFIFTLNFRRKQTPPVARASKA